MTPTLEEIARFMGKGYNVRGADLRNKKSIIPKNVDAKKSLEFLKINQIANESLKNGWVSLDFLYERGVQPYAPLQVMRQLARVQEIPPNDDMGRFVFDTPPGFAFDSTDILKIWFENIISELREMVVEQDKGKVVPGKRKYQHIIIQLEKVKATIARQEVQVQRERNHQLELHDVEGKLQHAEISPRDLVAYEKVVHYQKGELQQQKEKFEKERSCWMRLHDQLNAQLEEHKRKISHCVDIEEGQKQMIIERATLRHQLEAAEEQEALLRNNLRDHQVWLNNWYENMGRARRQVHQLAEQTSYVIKNHRRMNDPEVSLPKLPPRSGHGT
ncbi:hypothetical protein KY290_016977 [Solanum tuberosum]|uniref:Uncharacterized protein n=1 Tax=Solanum tuberosum TaxID=4113 RepID=A0ABQ7VA02_SOLTU|nr:hypothetical protein KY284_016052 [Solanum tuberosum]KAH0701765.1 hypothetical protein KY285_016043 [Solanum tuberosum]KAH0760904.1 hypothetical protein KY290_016977 [Solanum tuberosum]